MSIHTAEEDLVSKKKYFIISTWFRLKRSDEQHNSVVCREFHKSINSIKFSAPKQSMLQASFIHAVPCEKKSAKCQNITKAAACQLTTSEQIGLKLFLFLFVFC